MADQYRADQVGSLLPTPALLRARAAYRAGTLPLAGLRAAEDRTIATALALQREAGMQIFTDGELRRETLFSVVTDAVDGFVSAPPQRGGGAAPGLPDAGEPPEKVIGGPLRRLFRLTRLEVAFLRRHAPGPIKVTLPSPVAVMHALYRPGISERAYPNPEAVLDDLVPIVREELQALVAEGVAYLQLDEGFLGFMGEGWRGRLRLLGQDPDGALERAIAAENACYDALPRERVTLAIHLCRRNARGPWGGIAGYEELAERLFNDLHVDRFLLEYDCERAGSFSPLRFVPRGKTAVLGLVSSRQSWLETPENLLSRIDEASRYLPLEQLAISTQCGFARAAARELLSEADQRTKLQLVADTARAVWGREPAAVGTALSASGS
jgi:5-methyltetrahydropteroyltriglutamate--homocysteine methyltransferase